MSRPDLLLSKTYLTHYNVWLGRLPSLITQFGTLITIITVGRCEIFHWKIATTQQVNMQKNRVLANSRPPAAEAAGFSSVLQLVGLGMMNKTSSWWLLCLHLHQLLMVLLSPRWRIWGGRKTVLLHLQSHCFMLKILYCHYKSISLHGCRHVLLNFLFSTDCEDRNDNCANISSPRSGCVFLLPFVPRCG